MSGRLDAFFEFVRRGLVEPMGRLVSSMADAFRALAAGILDPPAAQRLLDVLAGALQ